MRWSVVVSLCLGLACGPSRRGAEAPSPAPPGHAILEVHADWAAPLSLRTVQVGRLSGWRPQQSSRLDERTVEAFPAEVTCPLGSACLVSWGTPPVVGLVFAFDPRVAVELGDAVEVSGGMGFEAAVHYRDPDSTSAALAEVYEGAAALAQTCRPPDAPPAIERPAAAQPRSVAPLEASFADPRLVVRNAARLAWMAEQCGSDDEARDLAAALLAELPIDAPSIALWPRGLAMAAVLGPDPEGTMVRYADGSPDPNIGANVLLETLWLTRARNDEDLAGAALDHLRTDVFADTLAQAIVDRAPPRPRFAVDSGDPLPRLWGAAHGTGEAIDTDAMRGRPLLAVLTSVHCRPCHEQLPAILEVREGRAVVFTTSQPAVFGATSFGASAKYQ